MPSLEGFRLGSLAVRFINMTVLVLVVSTFFSSKQPSVDALTLRTPLPHLPLGGLRCKRPNLDVTSNAVIVRTA